MTDRQDHDRISVLLVVEQLRRVAPGGIGTYARGLMQGLLQSESDPGPDTGRMNRAEVELLASRPGRRHRNEDGTDPLSVIGLPLRTSLLPGPALTRAWDHRLLHAPSGFDVVHSLSMATPDPGRAALVATVHDLLWRQIPEAYPPRGRAWHEAALQRLIARANHFVVPSRTVADELCQAGAPGQLITVIPMGADHLPPPDVEAGAALLERLGVGSDPFLLSVGTLEPRKNLVRLTEAYGMIRDSLPGRWPMVVVGPNGWGDRLVPSPGVVPAGLVTPGELSALYSQAVLLAYVPLTEGFGIPPIEAMVAGIPVVSSPLPSTGGASLEVDPYDTRSIADGLVTVATDEPTRRRLVDAGRIRAAELSWDSIAKRHRELWAATAEGGASRGR